MKSIQTLAPCWQHRTSCLSLSALIKLWKAFQLIRNWIIKFHRNVWLTNQSLLKPNEVLLNALSRFLMTESNLLSQRLRESLSKWLIKLIDWLIDEKYVRWFLIIYWRRLEELNGGNFIFLRLECYFQEREVIMNWNFYSFILFVQLYV